MKDPQKIVKKLDDRRAANAFRSLSFMEEGYDFCSNDYLGVAQKSVRNEYPDGATGSRLISGNHTIHTDFEKEAATFFGMPNGLLFNSGYDANLGFFSAVPQRGDVILYDEFIHASIRDGIRMSFARSFSFRHNDVTDLSRRIANCDADHIYVVVESVYSMDGDKAPLEALVEQCRAEHIYLVVDEAHAGGVFGPHGEGLVSEQGLNEHVFAKLITFGKAFGSHGGLILGSEVLCSFLINFSRPFIYTTALPPSAVARLQFAIQWVKNAEEARQKLADRIAFFQAEMAKTNLSYLKSTSPIQGVIIAGNDAVKEKALKLQQRAFFVKPILSPTVAVGEERIRICLHSYNTEENITQLINALK